MHEIQQNTSEIISAWDKYFSCDGKVRYGRAKTANKACKSMRNKGALGLEPYACRYCDGWHIGHAPKSPQIIVNIWQS